MLLRTGPSPRRRRRAVAGALARREGGSGFGHAGGTVRGPAVAVSCFPENLQPGVEISVEAVKVRAADRDFRVRHEIKTNQRINYANEYYSDS